MLDGDGYRLGVGMVIYRRDGKLLWCKRKGFDAWQFPQGGIEKGETPEQAMWRELQEEVGLLPTHVHLMRTTNRWLRYELPEELNIVYRGQKQIWFLLKLLVDDKHINLTAADEFNQWRWVHRKRTLEEIVDFKRAIYGQVLESFILSD